MLTLYDGTTSVCAIKVRLALHEKGIAFDSHNIDLRAGEQFDPDTPKLNPNAVVPTLVDSDDVVINPRSFCNTWKTPARSSRCCPTGRSTGRKCGLDEAGGRRNSSQYR